MRPRRARTDTPWAELTVPWPLCRGSRHVGATLRTSRPGVAGRASPRWAEDEQADHEPPLQAGWPRHGRELCHGPPRASRTGCRGLAVQATPRASRAGYRGLAAPHRLRRVPPRRPRRAAKGATAPRAGEAAPGPCQSVPSRRARPPRRAGVTRPHAGRAAGPRARQLAIGPPRWCRAGPPSRCRTGQPSWGRAHAASHESERGRRGKERTRGERGCVRGGWGRRGRCGEDAPDTRAPRVMAAAAAGARARVWGGGAGRARWAACQPAQDGVGRTGGEEEGGSRPRLG
jgi:hypothetical protein